MVYLDGSRRKKETLCGKIDWFTQVIVEIGSMDDKFKCCMFNKGVRSGFLFREKMALEGVCNLSDFLNKKHPYINYKEEILAEEWERGPEVGNSG